MGGNTFANTTRIREPTHNAMRGIAQRAGGFAPPSVREKKSHGDVDILVPSADVSDRVVAAFLDAYKEIVESVEHNCNSKSILVQKIVDGVAERYQVDIQIMHPDIFDFACGYFSYNDLGNLLGRIAHRMGLKFGHDGLWFVLNHGDYHIGDFLLTGSFARALQILGLDIETFSNGFDTFEEMFTWVESSKHFDPSGYALENRSHRSRTRDRKRPTYTMFLAWLADRHGGELPEYTCRKRDRWMIQHMIDFPDLAAWISDSLSARRQAVTIKKRLTDQRIGETFGLAGPSLGAFMAHIRRSLSADDILSSTPDELTGSILCEYEVFKNTL